MYKTQYPIFQQQTNFKFSRPIHHHIIVGIKSKNLNK